MYPFNKPLSSCYALGKYTIRKIILSLLRPYTLIHATGLLYRILISDSERPIPDPCNDDIVYE